MDNNLFLIEEKEAKISLLKANAYFEASNHGLLFSGHQKSITDNIKMFFDNLIETIKDTARKIELQISAKINEIQFNVALANLKKLTKSKDFKFTKSAGTIDIVDLRKVQMEFDTCINECIKATKLLYKCKTRNELRKITSKINDNINRLEKFGAISKLDKFVVKMDAFKYITFLEKSTFKKSASTMSANMINDLKTLKNDVATVVSSNTVRTTINDLGGEKITNNEIVQTVQHASSRICHYTTKYLLSASSYILGTIFGTLGRYNDQTAEKFTDYGVKTKNVNSLMHGVAVTASNEHLKTVGSGLKIAAGLGAIQTTRELANEISSKK